MQYRNIYSTSYSISVYNSEEKLTVASIWITYWKSVRFWWMRIIEKSTATSINIHICCLHATKRNRKINSLHKLCASCSYDGVMSMKKSLAKVKPMQSTSCMNRNVQTVFENQNYRHMHQETWLFSTLLFFLSADNRRENSSYNDNLL